MNIKPAGKIFIVAVIVGLLTWYLWPQIVTTESSTQSTTKDSSTVILTSPIPGVHKPLDTQSVQRPDIAPKKVVPKKVVPKKEVKKKTPPKKKGERENLNIEL